MYSTFELPIEKSYSRLYLITWMWPILFILPEGIGFFFFNSRFSEIPWWFYMDWIFVIFFFLFLNFSPIIFSVCMFCNASSSLLNLRLTLFCYLFSCYLLYFCFAFCKISSTLSSNSSVDFFFSYDIFICKHSFLFLNILSYCILFLPP